MRNRRSCSRRRSWGVVRTVFTMDGGGGGMDILLGTSRITRRVRCLPASRREVPNRWLADKVIVAVAWSRNAVDATDDDVCAQ